MEISNCLLTKKSESGSLEQRPEFKSRRPHISEQCGLFASALIRMVWQWATLIWSHWLSFCKLLYVAFSISVRWKYPTIFRYYQNAPMSKARLAVFNCYRLPDYIICIKWNQWVRKLNSPKFKCKIYFPIPLYIFPQGIESISWDSLITSSDKFYRTLSPHIQVPRTVYLVQGTVNVGDE